MQDMSDPPLSSGRACVTRRHLEGKALTAKSATLLIGGRVGAPYAETVTSSLPPIVVPDALLAPWRERDAKDPQLCACQLSASVALSPMRVRHRRDRPRCRHRRPHLAQAQGAYHAWDRRVKHSE
jgi:hypothetical protein